MQIPSIIREVLKRSGISRDADIAAHLSPKLSDLPSPWDMKGLKEAAEIVCDAISLDHEIVIWGDYDVDGTCGTSLLVNFFRELAVEPGYYIPNRLTEGYGLHVESFEELHEKYTKGKPFLLITVDCGISNGVEIEKIKEKGGRVVVTDHHQLPLDALPKCTIVNPSQEGCGFGAYKLAGVGVAFYLAIAIRSLLERRGCFADCQKPNMKEYLGFVALGTIADLVEMTAINRILVRGGMEILGDPQIPGLRSLMQSAELLGSVLTTEDVSFTLAPRINAAGRLGSAEVAVELMTCNNMEEGARLGRVLEGYNDKRKNICQDNLETALGSIVDNEAAESSSIVISGDFHFGIIGIVASKLIDKYGKPALVFSRDQGEGGQLLLKGSGRSIDGVNLLECLHEVSSLLIRYGGHSMAAGMSLAERDFDAFRKKFDLAVFRQLAARKVSPLRETGFGCDIDEIMSKIALDFLLRLEPFGPENLRPVFFDSNATVIQSKQIGSSGEHLQMTIRGRYENYRAIGFGLGSRRAEVKKAPTRKIVFTPMINRFRGKADWQLRILDI